MLSTHKKIENYSYINGYPLQCSHLENPMDRGSWQVPVHGVAKNLSMHAPRSILST